ncbi:MAG: flagellar basal-body MS-ring/collar protein FliF [Burkholderiaceae bacterium]|jgi:flagellar M-ring protein FliF
MSAMQRFLQLPPRQLIGLTVAIAASIALVAAAWMWTQTPDYRVLYSNLADRDGGAIVQALNQMNIPYKFSDGGGAILVPSNVVYDTRLKLASQGLPKGGTAGFELMEQQKFGATQFQEQVNYQRGLEGELAKTIQSVASVQSARVHLAIPKSSVFLRDQQKPSASVLLNLYPGKSLDRGQVNGILHLVSSSIPELTAQNVSIVDQNGNLLTTQAAAADGLDPGQLAYLQEMEQNYTRRVLGILQPITGAENVRAQVTADVDFSQNEQTAEIYKPNSTPAESAIRSQQTSEGSSLNSSGAAAPGGIPGAASNLPQSPPPAATPAAPGTTVPATGAPGQTNPTQNTTNHKETTVNYEVDKTVQMRRTPVGALKRLSVAIVVNQHKITGKDGKVTFEPLEKAQLDQITALAREAVGFSQDRGDSLNVVNAAFSQTETEAPVEVAIWKDPDNIAMVKEVGKDILLGILVLYLVFGILKPSLKKLLQAPMIAPELVEHLPAGSAPALDHEPAYAESLQLVKKLARDDPKVVANVVKGWVKSNG